MRFLQSLGVAALMAAASIQAVALDYATAESVVSLMEALAEDTQLRMSTGSGPEFFDYDAFDGERIPAAGFTEDSWIVAYDAVASAYLATIPLAEFEAKLSEPLDRLEASGLPEDQKQFMRDHMASIIDGAKAERERGMADAATVGPLVPRLRRLFGE